MYLGHLAAGLVLQARVREAPLSWLLGATIVSDLLCGALLIAGAEHATVHGAMVYRNIEADIGYSHSLVGTTACALVVASFGGTYLRSARVAVALGLAVLSHYVLDALSHCPDMPLFGFGIADDVRLGTSLSQRPLAFFLVELGWCGLAFWLYDRSNRRLAVTMLVLMLLYTNIVFGFMPPPAPSAFVFGVSMIVVFVSTFAVVLWAARRPSVACLQNAVFDQRRE
jgi:hypothetical protein